jgi:hypothetical protein
MSDNRISAAEKKIRLTWAAYREALKERAEIQAEYGVYFCSVCLIRLVDPPKGEDTCPRCINNA